MRSIVLEGRFETVVKRNPFEAVYLFRDIECGEVLLNVPKKLSELYSWVNMAQSFRLLVKVEGSSYRRSLADPVRNTNKLTVVKLLK